jgi:hypothetical protein
MIIHYWDGTQFEHVAYLLQMSFHRLRDAMGKNIPLSIFAQHSTLYTRSAIFGGERVGVPLLQRGWVGEHGDRKGSPLRDTLRHTSRSGYGSAPAMQQHDAHPGEQNM